MGKASRKTAAYRQRTEVRRSPRNTVFGDLPRLEDHVQGSFWHSEGSPCFAPDHDTNNLWPVLRHEGCRLGIVVAGDGTLYRIGRRRVP
jgi:hypothetical protein